MGERKEVFFKAQVAEKAERFDDMVSLMKELVRASGGQGLSLEERNLLSVAFKSAVGARRLSWRIVCQLEEKQKKRKNTAAELATAEYREKVEGEIRKMCSDAIGLVNDHLLHTAKEPEDVVFYRKMLGDYNRYLAENSKGEAKKEAISHAGSAYQDAVQEAYAKLKPRHPVRLGLELNLAVFTFEVLEKHSDAITLAETAYHSASTGVGSQEHRDTTLVMQLLKDNIRVWKEKA
eukprot:CAMPEP_0113845048 /NCGR_PEP_ID=MMETSP0372-20130328/551_1 /TAXON_ID=340204 /ORGANISM="Lankesteria abbotti" /LENGTH=234 /DNA_ID=CAMNT_0000814069 /DNA_START=67 /DNA_END=771 /DNA_ORIENTATION=- /assembly_acc=CAM_ASM_000359